MSSFIFCFGAPLSSPYSFPILIILILFLGVKIFYRPGKNKKLPSPEPKQESPEFHRYTFLFPCENCGQDNQATKDLIDTSQNCWSCQETLIVPPDTGRGGKPIVPENSEPEKQEAIAELEPETKICPKCAETIKYQAVKCRYCGSDLVNNDNAFKLATDPALSAGFSCLVMGVLIPYILPAFILLSVFLFFVAFILSIVGMAKGKALEGIALIALIIIANLLVLPALNFL